MILVVYMFIRFWTFSSVWGFLCEFIEMYHLLLLKDYSSRFVWHMGFLALGDFVVILLVNFFFFFSKV